MARKTMPDLCMFCAPGDPCELHQPKPEKPKPPRKPRVKSSAGPTEPAPGPDGPADAPAAVAPDPTPAPPEQSDAMRDAMRRRVTARSAPTAPPVPAPEPVRQASVLEDAIRALAPILDPIERRAYEKILAQPMTVDGRARAWKDRVKR